MDFDNPLKVSSHRPAISDPCLWHTNPLFGSAFLSVPIYEFPQTICQNDHMKVFFHLEYFWLHFFQVPCIWKTDHQTRGALVDQNICPSYWQLLCIHCTVHCVNCTSIIDHILNIPVCQYEVSRSITFLVMKIVNSCIFVQSSPPCWIRKSHSAWEQLLKCN